MKITTDGRGRVQISAYSSVTRMSLQQSEAVLAQLTEATAKARIEHADYLASVKEAHERMAEALS